MSVQHLCNYSHSSQCSCYGSKGWKRSPSREAARQTKYIKFISAINSVNKIFITNETNIKRITFTIGCKDKSQKTTNSQINIHGQSALPQYYLTYKGEKNWLQIPQSLRVRDRALQHVGAGILDVKLSQCAAVRVALTTSFTVSYDQIAVSSLMESRLSMYVQYVCTVCTWLFKEAFCGCLGPPSQDAHL